MKKINAKKNQRRASTGDQESDCCQTCTQEWHRQTQFPVISLDNIYLWLWDLTLRTEEVGQSDSKMIRIIESMGGRTSNEGVVWLLLEEIS